MKDIKEALVGKTIGNITSNPDDGTYCFYDVDGNGLFSVDASTVTDDANEAFSDDTVEEDPDPENMEDEDESFENDGDDDDTD